MCTSWVRLSQVTQELGYGQDVDAEGVIRLVHDGTKVLQITAKQMGCLTSERCLEDWLDLLCKSFRVEKVCSMFNKVDTLQECVQTIQGLWKFPLQVAASFLQCIGAREQVPVALAPKFNDQCSFSCRVMCRSEQYVRVEKQPHFLAVVSLSTI